jgi:hypothetical protein
MHVMYDAPIFLKAEELRRVMATGVPPELQWVKDVFVLNCALGCRIGDLLRLTMDKVAVSEEGIPYVHYIPSKTARSQGTNHEIQTPLIEPALEIIRRTRLAFIVVTGGQVPRHVTWFMYPKYAELDRGLNQSVSEAA